jgi:hypothetical protein
MTLPTKPSASRRVCRQGLVTLGLRDFAANRRRPLPIRVHLPLDDKLFAIKGTSDLTIATVHGRVAVPFDVAGYSRGMGEYFPGLSRCRDQDRLRDPHRRHAAIPLGWRKT